MAASDCSISRDSCLVQDIDLDSIVGSSIVESGSFGCILRLYNGPGIDIIASINTIVDRGVNIWDIALLDYNISGGEAGLEPRLYSVASR